MPDESRGKVGAGGTVPELLDKLPELREELTLHPGPSGGDGAPTWSLQDPVRNLFFRIDWATFEILARWHLGDPVEIARTIEMETTLTIEPADVFNVLRFLTDNELLRIADAAGSQRYAAIARRRRLGTARWLLHHYLFFRLPLIRPDRLLDRMIPYVDPLFSLRFFKLTLVALAIGLIEVGRQWEGFSATLVDTFTWQGLAGYGCALVFVKTLHEFGHALTAKRFGCRVPVMGVAFLVMWPMAYTDVNETWKLPDRNKRLAVSGAGIATELAMAAWATLAWALLPDGALRGAMFLLCTTTWISTLAINASPFMRFDGYFLLCDWLDMPNLHQRAFTLARWKLREVLFRLGDPPPEYLPDTRRRGLIAFALITWLYRVVVFVGIAVVVYEFFIKLLGIVLFAIEIWWFLVMPAWSELKVWWQRRTDLRQAPRTRRTALIAGGLLAFTVIPWSVTVEGQGMLRPSQSFAVVTPANSRVTALPKAHGAGVAESEIVLALESPELQVKARLLQARMESVRFQVAASSLDQSLRSRRLVFDEELTGLMAQEAVVQQEIARLTPKAPFAGIVLDIPPDLAPGQWISRSTQIATIIDPIAWRVECFLPETEIGRVSVGNRARFIPETPGLTGYWLEVDRVDDDANRSLPEPMLAIQHGGQILAREKNRALVPDRALYRVGMKVRGAEALTQSLRGKVIILAEPRTLAGDFLQRLAGLLIREAGF